MAFDFCLVLLCNASINGFWQAFGQFIKFYPHPGFGKQQSSCCILSKPLQKQYYKWAPTPYFSSVHPHPGLSFVWQIENGHEVQKALPQALAIQLVCSKTCSSRALSHWKHTGVLFCIVKCRKVSDFSFFTLRLVISLFPFLRTFVSWCHSRGRYCSHNSFSLHWRCHLYSCVLKEEKKETCWKDWNNQVYSSSKLTNCLTPKLLCWLNINPFWSSLAG